jgi:hypothetical protein
LGGSGKQKSAKPIFGWSVGGLPPLKIEFDFKDFDFKDFDFIIPPFIILRLTAYGLPAF